MAPRLDSSQHTSLINILHIASQRVGPSLNKYNTDTRSTYPSEGCTLLDQTTISGIQLITQKKKDGCNAPDCEVFANN